MTDSYASLPRIDANTTRRTKPATDSPPLFAARFTELKCEPNGTDAVVFMVTRSRFLTFVRVAISLPFVSVP